MPGPEEDYSDLEQVPTPTQTEPGKIIPDKFLSDMRRQIRETIQEEMKKSLQFYSDKVDDFQETIDRYEEKVKYLENQNKDLQNKYTNMKNKYDLLEQKINSLEQTQIENKIEIAGVHKTENENLQEILKKICEKIKQETKDVIKIYRKESKASAGQKRSSSTLVVTLRDGCRDQWLEGAKSVTILDRDVGGETETKVFLREALTPATAHLLWRAKAELKETNLVRFVWCKRGNVLIRKSEKEKVHVIRSEGDIDRWAAALPKE